jgi:DNA polymerase-3 subunit delta'
MSFVDFPEQQDVIQLLQRSLARGRLAHAYLFAGLNLTELEAMARTLAKAINCENPPRRSNSGLTLDSCDTCASCRKIQSETHPDVFWVRPESKSRVITINQMRDLMQNVHLKPTYSVSKVAVVVAADRLNVQAANAFLKTLEEPPGDSVLILLTTEPQQILETILSRCLRLSFGGEASHECDTALIGWLEKFSNAASAGHATLLGRYRLLSLLLSKLTDLKTVITGALTEKSPLEDDYELDPRTREKLEEELEAAIEAEYRRQRSDLLGGVHWWLRDVWVETLRLGSEMCTYPQLAKAAQDVARRISTQQAMENLRVMEETQGLLASNVQEALALEVGLLKLQF